MAVDLDDALTRIRTEVRELRKQRDNAVSRIEASHEAAGEALRGLRASTGGCRVCGALEGHQHDSECVAWTIINWRDENHAKGAA